MAWICLAISTSRSRLKYVPIEAPQKDVKVARETFDRCLWDRWRHLGGLAKHRNTILRAKAMKRSYNGGVARTSGSGELLLLSGRQM